MLPCQVHSMSCRLSHGVKMSCAQQLTAQPNPLTHAQALTEWRAAGIKTYIYSSGSREAQRLFFGHSQVSCASGCLTICPFSHTMCSILFHVGHARGLAVMKWLPVGFLTHSI